MKKEICEKCGKIGWHLWSCLNWRRMYPSEYSELFNQPNEGKPNK